MSPQSQKTVTAPLRAAIIKLGGSVVTDKGNANLSICKDRLRRLAQEIKKAKLQSLVLVSGAGSYGHRIVAKTGIDKGVFDAKDRLAWLKPNACNICSARQSPKYLLMSACRLCLCKLRHRP